MDGGSSKESSNEAKREISEMLRDGETLMSNHTLTGKSVGDGWLLCTAQYPLRSQSSART